MTAKPPVVSNHRDAQAETSRTYLLDLKTGRTRPYSNPWSPLVPLSSSIVHQRHGSTADGPSHHSSISPVSGRQKHARSSLSPYPPAQEMKVHFQQATHSGRVVDGFPSHQHITNSADPFVLMILRSIIQLQVAKQRGWRDSRKIPTTSARPARPVHAVQFSTKNGSSPHALKLEDVNARRNCTDGPNDGSYQS